MSLPSKPLPFQPESFESMLARWPAALAKVMSRQEMEERFARLEPLPRENTFDFTDGVHMLASLENVERRVLLHISFGITGEFQIVWLQKPPGAFAQRVLGILDDLKSHALLTGPEFARKQGERAFHFWFLHPTSD
jgi:hypothetical protein